MGGDQCDPHPKQTPDEPLTGSRLESRFGDPSGSRFSHGIHDPCVDDMLMGQNPGTQTVPQSHTGIAG